MKEGDLATPVLVGYPCSPGLYLFRTNSSSFASSRSFIGSVFLSSRAAVRRRVLDASVHRPGCTADIGEGWPICHGRDAR